MALKFPEVASSFELLMCLKTSCCNIHPLFKTLMLTTVWGNVHASFRPGSRLIRFKVDIQILPLKVHWCCFCLCRLSKHRGNVRSRIHRIFSELQLSVSRWGFLYRHVCRPLVLGLCMLTYCGFTSDVESAKCFRCMVFVLVLEAWRWVVAVQLLADISVDISGLPTATCLLISWAQLIRHDGKYLTAAHTSVMAFLSMCVGLIDVYFFFTVFRLFTYLWINTDTHTTFQCQ